MSADADQVARWRAAGLRLGVEVISPCRIRLNDGSILEATALVKVATPRRGMVVDPEWAVLEPHVDQLLADGFGFSVVRVDHDEGLADLIQDWSGS
jgi:hypothetical protein